MYYKLIPGSELYKKLSDLQKLGSKYNRQAAELVRKLPGSPEFVTNRDNYWGGVAAVIFEEDKVPDGWFTLVPTHRFYVPDEDEAPEIFDKIQALPVISIYYVNEIIGFEPLHGATIEGDFITPILSFYPGEYIIMYYPCRLGWYTPPSDFIEIKGSEYKKLWDRIDLLADRMNNAN